MARVGHPTQYRRRSLLVLLWNEVPRIDGLLSPARQWELHRFYQPDDALGFGEFELHIAALKATDPSLANRVGKHFAQLKSSYLASGADAPGLQGACRRVRRGAAVAGSLHDDARPLAGTGGGVMSDENDDLIDRLFPPKHWDCDCPDREAIVTYDGLICGTCGKSINPDPSLIAG